MDLSKYVSQLREDFSSAAAAGDEQTQRTAALLGAAIEPAARLALMSALSDLAAEVTEALGDRTVEVRLDGRDVRVSVDADATPAEEPFERVGSGGNPFVGGPDAGDISRITLRLVEQIKSQAEQAASAQGMSLNSWVAQAVQGALAGRGQGGGPRGGWSAAFGSVGEGPDRKRDRDGRRIRGWVQG